MPRPRLRERLDSTAADSAILVAAPAGYGKRELILEWLESRNEPFAWLSLDEADNEFAGFVEYLILAIRTVMPSACSDALVLARSSDPPPPRALAIRFLSELDPVERGMFLVLEDLETITNPDIYKLISYLLKNPVSSMRLILCSRRDPPLSVSKLRARGQLMELGHADLAFDRAETEALLMKVAGVSPSAEALSNLQAKIEGWPAGLRLVMLAMQKEPDPNAYLLNLDYGPRSIEQYLEDEVLAFECRCLRDRLSEASILESISASLWEAVCGDTPCEHIGGLEVGNRRSTLDPIQTQIAKGIFLTPVDAEGKWYRYHTVFRRLLLEHLEREFDAEAIARLHTRASAWFESEGRIAESVQHASLAGDDIRAAKIVERNQDRALNSGDPHELEAWLGRVPGDLRRRRVGLLMAEAAIAYQGFEFWKLSAILNFVDEHDERLQASAERIFFQGVLAFFGGDVRGSAKFFKEVLDADPKAPKWIRLDSYFYRSLSLHVGGRGDEALRQIRAAIERSSEAQSSSWFRLVGASFFLRLLRGELIQDSWETVRMADSSNPHVRSWCSYALGIAALRRFDLVGARDHLSRIQPTLGWLMIDGQCALALALQMLGHADEADDSLANAKEVARRSEHAEDVLPISSCRARLAILRGDLEEARRWQKLPRRDIPLTLSRFATEVPVITECRVLAESKDRAELEKAAVGLERLWERFGALHYTCQQLEIGPLRALVTDRLGDSERALMLLRNSLERAEPEGWILPYIELGTPMADLLDRLSSEVSTSSFAQLILSVMDDRDSARVHESAPVPTLGTRANGSSAEALTNREFDVLELLAMRLRDKEIAERLRISPETVKTHLKSLYRKLDSRGRQEAVAEARERNILARSASDVRSRSRSESRPDFVG